MLKIKTSIAYIEFLLLNAGFAGTSTSVPPEQHCRRAALQLSHCCALTAMDSIDPGPED